MRIIPVIDLKNGQAVHGKSGQRESYRPVRSVLVEGSDPIRTADAFYRKLGCTELYVADLDAIERKGSNAELLKLFLIMTILPINTKMMSVIGVSVLEKMAGWFR